MFRNLSSTSKIKSLSAIWGLRKKILLSMITLLLLLGLTTTLITRTILLKVLKTEFQQKGLSSARSLAANSVVDVLTQNTSRLKQLVENEKKLDKDIAYVFIIDSARVLAHTFNNGFPVDLNEANKLQGGRDFNIQTLDTQLGFIYDIAVPIFSGRSLLGQARLGILQNSIQRTINTVNLIFMGITFLIMVIGIFLAYRVSSLITKPISKLVEATQSIQRGDFSTRIDVKTNDEIELLATAFNEMASRLNMMVEEIRQLTTVEERNRIAIDLHDGDAQDLANIIRRIELCEKLFKIDSQEAFKELSHLRESTKDILNRTRKAIFDLKSPQDSDFKLIDNLTNYVKNYEQQSDANIELDISGSINNISQDKSKSIFYIIAEALTNVRKHSCARNVELSMKTNNNNDLMINIKDDGKGFDINNTQSFASNQGKWGLMSMRERAVSIGGTFSIESKPQQGTEISINLPLADST